ncbi:Beta-galactosidase 7 [Spatholobus suberectus]|nr:Beta-galactosidase 7 [Spatholobus suberectus]
MDSSSWARIFLLSLAFTASCFATEVTYDAHSLIINGERRIIFSGAIHYPRSTVEMWPGIIQKAKDGGLDTIESYIFWDRHEPVRREYNFLENLDFIKFFKLIQEAGLYAILRIGPYVCAEWNYGGFPLWLHSMPGIELRTDNPIYKNEMQIFTTKIVNMAKEAKLFASQGGPIILAQIENEYGDIMTGYGDAGKTYIKWCAEMALAQNIGVPWIMCQQQKKKDTMHGKGSFKVNQLLEQKELTFDVSDYLWYMTSVDINDTSIWRNATLCVNTMGHTLDAYVNGRRVGYKFSQTGSNFTYEKQVSLKKGPNIITLLSATVGLANYGAKFDKIKTGIAGGPVHLIGKNNVTIDLSTNLWSYKVGLNGEKRRLYDPQPRIGVSWRSNSSYPIGRPMTWYKADFKAPFGTDPVVVDLQGLGKGHAWVNGHSIGRYWTSRITVTNGCSDTCDYRGKYVSEKCNTNCGNPSQRWYHVPRSFLNNDKNTLVLFEEIGGNPQNISFQTVTTGTICAQVNEGAQLELSCQGGQIISQIQFASFGNPKGKCGSFNKGTWEAANSQSVVEAACIGKTSCGFTVTKEAFGVTVGPMKVDEGVARLAVQATC